MSENQEGSQDYSPAYEALVEFLYLAPVGIIKFRPDGTIEMANPTAAQLLMPLTSDGDLSNLYGLLSGLAPDLRTHVERFQDPAGQIFDQMQLVVPDKRITLMLDINKINDATLMASLQNITDLTEARRQAVQETEAQRMLASVFMRVNAPIVVARADGFILMANTALQSLMGYDAKSLVGLNIDVLLPPECTEVARAARAQQVHDGATYEIETDIITKSGVRLQVLMNSAVLREANAKQFRVITLICDATTRKGLADYNKALRKGASLEAGRIVHQVKTIDLSKIQAAVGREDWQAMGSRGITMAESAIKRLLYPGDIVKQGKDNSFVIWFTTDDVARNAAILAQATQEVRRIFMMEFGMKIGDRVRTALGTVSV